MVDNGIGIASEHWDSIFQPFFQAENPLVKMHEGSGLGLAISRKLIEGQGGTIGVTSKPGAGSIFYFTLPVAEEPPAAPGKDAT